MPLKRARASSSSPVFDDFRFVSAAAEERFDKGIKKVAIIERGFEITPGLFPDIEQMIAERHWQKLCQQPKPACISVVREFYANAAQHVAYTVMVRGRQVSFDAATINKFYGIPEIHVDDYSVLRNEIDITQLTETLCIPTATWEMSSSGEHMKMSSKFLKPDARVWFHFLTRSLLPGTHITFVTKERMVLLYCLMEGLAIDVGVLISTNIAWAANSTQAGLYYCHLVTSLCTLAMVPIELREETTQPMTALTARIIQQLRTERQISAGSSSSAPAATSQQPPPQPQRAARSRSITDRLGRLERRVDYLTDFNIAMGQAFQQLARDMHVTVPQFPGPPVYSDEEETDE